MLSKEIINKILEIGFYFDDEFNFDENKVELTKESREWFRDNLGIENLESTIVEFYSFFSGGCGLRDEADPLFELQEVLDAYTNPFWGDVYPGIENRFLQLSSIEGEHSYFYDKNSDSVYSADWSQMSDLMNEKLTPIFSSFEEFLEWFFSIK